MYDIVRNVANPAMTSVRTVDPRSEMWKYLSSVPPVPVDGGACVLATASLLSLGPGPGGRADPRVLAGKSAEG
jgi:hypothetical protein